VIGADSHEQLVERVGMVIERLLTANFKINWKKTTLVSSSVNWCGRKISGEGFGFDEKRISTLMALKSPTTVSQLIHLVHAFNWVRIAIANYAIVMQPLLELLEENLKLIGSRKKKKCNMPLQGWQEIHSTTFENIKGIIARNTLLNSPRPENELVVSSDASDTHWSFVITQVPSSELVKPVDQQIHSPVAFCSGTFKNSSLSWSTWEKELYPIVACLKRFNYLLHRQKGFVWFTDSNNVRYMFDPQTSYTKNRVLMDKIIRWNIALSSYKYEVRHVAGSHNFWCDMLTRFGHPSYTNKREITIEHTKNELEIANIRLPKPIDDWPSVDELLRAQEDINLVGDNWTKDIHSGLWVNKENRIYVPDKSDLRSRLSIIGHHGHLGRSATCKVIQEYFVWEDMVNEISLVVDSCLHCKQKRKGLVPTSLGQQLSGTYANEVITFDYSYMPESENGMKFVFILKDTFSGFIRLVPTENATSHAAASAIVDWISLFGTPKGFLSDQGSHFVGGVMESLRKTFKIAHRFTISYVPKSNGSAERVNADFKGILTGFCSEFRLPQTNWVSILPLVTSIINNRISKRRGNLAPIEIFTGLKRSSPLSSILVEGEFKLVKWGARVEKSASGILEALDKQRLADSKKKAKWKHFDKGSYVLVWSPNRSKLGMKWKGPFEVEDEISPHVFKVLDKLGRSTVVHADHLLQYDVENGELSKEEHEQQAFNQKGGYYEVKEIRDLIYDGAYKFLVEWAGFENKEDNTYEEFEQLLEDVPGLVKAYIKGHKKDTLVKKLVQEYKGKL
jgi:hypothetical protein